MPGLNKNLQESRTIANYIPLKWISVYKLTPGGGGGGGGVIPILGDGRKEYLFQASGILKGRHFTS